MSIRFLILLTALIACGSSLAGEESGGAKTLELKLDVLEEEGTRVFLYERQGPNNTWGKAREYVRAEALKLLRGIVGARIWDGRKYSAAFGSPHAHAPGLAIGVMWKWVKTMNTPFGFVTAIGCYSVMINTTKCLSIVLKQSTDYFLRMDSI